MKADKLTFSDAIEKVLRENGGYAPLKLIYREFERHRSFTGKTPLKTIQERVQRDPRFRRIGLGVYALTSELSRLPQEPKPKSPEQKAQATHGRVQGMLIEIGNMDGFDTYTPDAGKLYENKRLGSIATVKTIPQFTYPHVVSAARFIDVIWFNVRRFPQQVFEVEASTDFRSALVKFAELQDFAVAFFLVAPDTGLDKYRREVARAAFAAITDRCKFWSFSKVQKLYESRLELEQVRRSM